MRENAFKAVLYFVLALVIAKVALETADCHQFSRILYDKGNSTAGQTARFYFLTWMGLAIIVVQNPFIRLALRVQAQNAPSEVPARPGAAP